MVVTLENRELTSNDRCDKCGAQALVVTTFLSGELLFCGHHAREIKNTLKEKALSIYDPNNEVNLLK